MEQGVLEAEWRAQRANLLVATLDAELSREAHLLLWQVCQFLRDPEAAGRHLQAALASDALVVRARPVGAPPPSRTVLMLAVPGDFQANLPLDRLFDDSTRLLTFWLTDPQAVLRDPAAWIPDGLPEIDAVFIGIAEDPRHGPALRAADALADAIGVAVINRGELIGRLSRTGAASLLRGVEHAVVPSHAVLTCGMAAPSDFPMIIRPLGSHAGAGLALLGDEGELSAFYRLHPEVMEFTASPFVDYRSGDGLWRKMRIIFVGGRPYPLHLAIHDDWAVWYYNAHMERWPRRKHEEQQFLSKPDNFLPHRAMTALHEIARRVGLDYFGLDCALLQDGRLLVFEVETGMIVHRNCGAAGARILRAVECMVDQGSSLHPLGPRPQTPDANQLE